MGDGAFCGVFDGHGKNGHVVSEIVRNRLPLLLLSQKDAITKLNAESNEDVYENFSEKTNCDESVASDLDQDSQKWREAITSSFKLMDKEIKLGEHLDLSCSGTTAVVAIKQVREIEISNSIYTQICIYFQITDFFLLLAIEI